MFTGLVEELGTIQNIENLGGGIKITVKANLVIDGLKIDDSVAIEGCCQTVIEIQNDCFSVIAIEETLRKTNFNNFKVGTKVNLERALTLNTRLGGHLVQGHVDTVGKVENIIKEVSSYLITVRFPNEYEHLLIPTGSICMNGISLTTAKVNSNTFTVAIIPHTWEVTSIALLEIGTSVNLEFDMIGKYIEKLMMSKSLKSNDVWEKLRLENAK
jgi:riboflavin synthase